MKRLLCAAALAAALLPAGCPFGLGVEVGSAGAEELPRLPRAGDVIEAPWHCPVADVPLRVLDYATRGFAGAAQALVSMAVGAGRCWGSVDEPAPVRLEAVVHAQELGRGWMEVWRGTALARVPPPVGADGAGPARETPPAGVSPPVGADGAGPARGSAADRTVFVAFHVEPVQVKGQPL